MKKALCLTVLLSLLTGPVFAGLDITRSNGISLTGADEITCATVQLWPTAYRFARGHRIRVQVSSGAFPRYARNTGTGEPLATATTLRAADQAVYHDPQHPSAVTLPVRAAGSGSP